jgi:large subunit ribosomal protein L24
MYKIKKNDTIEVIKGKDKGKKGRVLEVFHENGRALVEGINMVKKHKRQTKQEEKGGIVSLEAPIALANILPVCKACNRGMRVGFKVLADKTKARYCKRCKETL